jgi:insulysin
MQFFIAPLISPDGIARERQAVDSEHSKNLNVDGWRQQQLWKEVANPKSRYSRFFTGSLETLGTVPEEKGIDVHGELKAFYDREYSASRMKLCVLGRETLDELQELVFEKFTPVENKGVPQPLFASPPACSALFAVRRGSTKVNPSELFCPPERVVFFVVATCCLQAR